MASPIINMTSSEDLIISYEVFISDLVGAMFPIVSTVFGFMAVLLILRTVLTVHSTGTRSTPMHSNIPAAPKQYNEPSTKPINLTKAPKVKPRPLNEWIRANDAPPIQSVLEEVHEVSTLITEHESLLPFEQKHLYETLQRDLVELLLSYDELRMDSSKQEEHIPILLNSLQTVKRKLDEIQQVIFRTKEFRFQQKVAHIEHR